jgi:histidinol dehydrogenase
MKVILNPDVSRWPEILKRPVMDVSSVDRIVLPVLEDVRRNGDKAVLKYTRKFDGADLSDIRVSGDEIMSAGDDLDNSFRDAVELAVRNIEKFHLSQVAVQKTIETSEGVRCWQKSLPIEKVGLYVPGGTAPLFSTVLMLAIPARIAGCHEIILCSPPGKDGRINPAILYAASVTGVTAVYRIGGAQAVAAMAYGTETVPRVYKIFGPGNQFVMAAKQIVSRESVAIDMPAGPSEVMVVADGDSRPEFVASDLLSQAEHGPDSQVILVTASRAIVDAVLREIDRQVSLLPRKDAALRSLENSRAIVVNNNDEIAGIINEYAPEHLIISTSDADSLAEKVVNAGSVFIGHYTPESAGDYISGTNHTLPTNGYARMYNGVNLDSFVKKITFQKITPEGLMKIGPSIMKMAQKEELIAHSNAVGVRLEKK